MSNDVHWLIDGTRADYLTNELPTLTRGTEQTLQLWFEPSEVDTADSYGESRYGHASYGGSVGGGHVNRHQAVLDYLEFANRATLTTPLSDTGIPHFRESLPSSAAVSSLVVEIVPSDEISRATGVWALVVGGQDTTPPGHSALRLELDIHILADHAEYASEQAVINDLGSPLV